VPETDFLALFRQLLPRRFDNRRGHGGFDDAASPTVVRSLPINNFSSTGRRHPTGPAWRFIMPLLAPEWKDNSRLQKASNNAPSLHPGDPDAAAVRLLQQALMDTGFLHITAPTGVYGPQTSAAVHDLENTYVLDTDSGIAGRQVLGTLDLLMRGLKPATGGRSGASLAEADKPLAQRKLNAALRNLTALRAALNTSLANGSAAFDPLTTHALSTHFKLNAPGVTATTGRAMTLADIDLIINRYRAINNVLSNSVATFTSGTPENGVKTAAEAPFGGPIRFGPAFADFDNDLGKRIGPNSRVAVILHEATHVVDDISGQPLIHISEFQPAYATQPTDLALHNPSAYASFAGEIDRGRDPKPRFGLGPGARGL